MDIIYSLKDISFKADTVEELYDKICEFFTLDGISAQVTIKGDIVHVHISEEYFEKAEKEFKEILSLCDKQKFAEAKSRVEKFLQNNPRHSEAYRIKAQLIRQEGKPNEAFDVCLDALRCNPRNIWALMLMGNIYNQDLHDLDVAKTYYDKILEYYPDNMIAINNIAAIYAEKGNPDEAAKMFEKAISLDKTYENAYYGLANIYYSEKKFEKSFETARKGCVNGVRRPENPQVTEELRKLMLASAQAIVDSYNYDDVFLGIKDILEENGCAEIRVEKDENLKVYAQLKYGPIRGHSWHQLRYNPKRPYIPHLMVHELMHLDMIQEANKGEIGAKVIYSSSENEAAFRSRFSAWTKNLINKIGYTKAIEITSQVNNGLLLQAMNCPLDLFVEQRMYDKYQIIRPIQLLSLLAQEQENIKAIEGTMSNKFLPQAIVRASKIMNIVTSLHFEHLFGIRLYQYYKPTKVEFDDAQELYEEYTAYADAEPGEEYDLVEFFIDRLGLDDFVTITSESEFIAQNNELKQQFEDTRDDVLGNDADASEGNSFDGLSEEQQKNQDRFFEQHKDGADPTLTMMMSMYMLSALQLFDKKDKDYIQHVAFEIAMIGTKGISPEKNYVVSSLGDKEMGGYQLLAYYYVSWKLFNPELHKTLALPFDSAYEMALQMFNKNK